MSSNVGLATPRGSGTSGYVQKSLSHLRPRDPHPAPGALTTSNAPSRVPDAGILAHNAARRIEAEVFALRDELEEAGEDEEEIDTRCDALRKKLTAEQGGAKQDKDKPRGTHDVAAAKAREDEKLRRALGIRKDYEEGSHWREQRAREMEGKDRERSRSRSPPRRKNQERERRRSRSLRRSRSPRRGYRDMDRPARRDRSDSRDRPSRRDRSDSRDSRDRPARRDRSESRDRPARRARSDSRGRRRSESYSDSGSD